MTPHESAAAWLPRAESRLDRPLGRVGGALLIAIAAVVLAQYLAGYFFLWSVNADPRQATPLTIARYGYYFSGHQHVRTRLIVASSVGAALVILTGGALLLPRRRSLHGDARFARRREVSDAGLFATHGIVLGRVGRRCLMLGGQQGVALAAPPRSGKGVGVVVPNALTWPGSLVCVDIKKENWTLTAGYRQKCGQQCFLFDPFAEDGNTAHWNPFFYVSSDPHRRVNDLQRIGDMLYPDPPNVDPFWTASARSLFLGIALYLFETPSLPKTIGEVLRQGMASDDEGFGQHWKRLIEGRNSGRFPLSSQCVRALYDVIDLAPVTASSIRKTFTSRLDLWLNPMLDAATSSNDFDLRDLRKRPLSIYVGVNPDDLHRLRPVLNLFFQQSIGLQTRELPERNPELKHQVMMLLDEFTALGRIPIIAEAISYLPGYNVRVVLVIQTPAQLREVYGANGAETMLKSLAARIVFAPKDFPDAREISDELGFTTVPVKTLSRPAFDLGKESARRSRSISISEQRRALLLPQEVKALGADDAIVFYEGLRPIRCKKIRYFQDPRFNARLLPPPASAALSRVAQPSGSIDAAAASQCPAGVVAGGQDMQQVELEFRVPEVVRDATLADIDRIESLTLDDFAADFDKVTLPEKAEGERMTSEELKVAAESFLATLREH
jgi:type IV secretion system protein VirD4